jgi:NADP-dependent 3-hydroxy acid dehydrogenase YdfG
MSTTVFITGASSGIGRAAAEAYAKAGARLVLCARKRNELETLAARLKRRYRARVYHAELDVRDRRRVERFMRELPKAFAAIDILVNNAGLALGLEPLQNGRIEDWEAMLDTNVKGLLYVTRAVLPGMLARKKGHIVNVSSVAGHRVYSGGNVYCASKHAVDALGRALKKDLEGTALRVTNISPGAVQTNFSNVRFHGDKKKAAKVYENMRPLTAADIAELIVFATSRPAHVNVCEMMVLATDQASLW